MLSTPELIGKSLHGCVGHGVYAVDHTPDGVRVAKRGSAADLMTCRFWDTYIHDAHALPRSDEFGVAALRSALGYPRMPTAV